MGMLAASDSDVGRIITSVHFTEQYMERVKSLFGEQPAGERQKPPPQPIRGVLLQDVYDGQDGLMQLIGRDEGDSSFFIQIVGQNLKDTTNTFKLQLTGVLIAEDGTETQTVISLSAPLSCTISSFDLAVAIKGLSRVLTADNVSVGLGNPTYDEDLQVYGSVVDRVVKPYSPPASYVGAWFVDIDATPFFPAYDYLLLDAVQDSDTTMNSLTAVVCTRVKDLLTPETELVTDVHNRTQAYPWQAGSIVVCMDFADIGYGIVSSTSRNMEIV